MQTECTYYGFTSTKAAAV